MNNHTDAKTHRYSRTRPPDQRNTVPRAAAGAVLAAGLSAFIAAYLFSEDSVSAALCSVMLLCSALTAAAELLGVSAVTLAGAASVCALSGAALLFVPRSGDSLYYSLIAGKALRLPALLPPCLLLCAAVCFAVCLLNRYFTARRVMAAGLLIMLAAFAWLRIELMKLPAVLITAYVIMILCQVCASAAFLRDGAGRGHETWFVAFSLIIATLVFVLPYPKTRIKWDTWFNIAPTEQMEQLGEKLDIDTLDEGGIGGKSGYSEDQSNLGGWLEFSNSARLRVNFSDNDHSDRLVGGIYESYTGKGWLSVSPPEGTGYPVPSVVMSNAEAQGAYGVVSVFEMYDYEKERRRDQGGSPALFYPPGTYRIIDGSSGKHACRNGRSMTFPEYSNENFEFSRNGYKAYYLKRSQAAGLTEKERELYLSLPAELPERIGQLASDVTMGCRTDAEKADGIMRLLSGYEYEIRVRETPDGADFVDWFLFDTKKGYCEYYASAAAVLARCAGIPSRYMQGFLVPNNYGATFTVSSRDAHAWAEFYIEGRGWVVYDPVTDPVFTQQPVSLSDVPDAAAPESENDRSGFGRIMLYAYAIAASLAGLLALFRPALRRAAYYRRLKRKYGRLNGYNVIKECSRMLWVLAACGVTRSADETLRELGQRANIECGWLDNAASERMNALLEAAGKAIYSPSAYIEDGADRIYAAKAVRRAFIGKHGRAKYYKGRRRAVL